METRVRMIRTLVIPSDNFLFLSSSSNCKVSLKSLSLALHTLESLFKSETLKLEFSDKISRIFNVKVVGVDFATSMIENEII